MYYHFVWLIQWPIGEPFSSKVSEQRTNINSIDTGLRHISFWYGLLICTFCSQIDCNFILHSWRIGEHSISIFRTCSKYIACEYGSIGIYGSLEGENEYRHPPFTENLIYDITCDVRFSSHHSSIHGSWVWIVNSWHNLKKTTSAKYIYDRHEVWPAWMQDQQI